MGIHIWYETSLGWWHFFCFCASSCLAPSFPYAIPNLPLVDPMGSPYLCLSLFLNFPLLLCKAHWVGRKCFQVLVLLQSNSSFILSISEILGEELPSVPTAILLPCDLRGKKMAGQSSRAGPGVVLCGGCCGGPWSSLATAAPMQLSGLRGDPLLRCSRTTFRYLSCCHSKIKVWFKLICWNTLNPLSHYSPRKTKTTSSEYLKLFHLITFDTSWPGIEKFSDTCSCHRASSLSHFDNDIWVYTLVIKPKRKQ